MRPIRRCSVIARKSCARSWLDVTHENDRKTNWALYRDFLGQKQKQVQVEKRYRRKDGQVLWVSNNISLLPSADGTPAFIMALVEDITERKRLQARLELERGRLRLLLEVNNCGGLQHRVEAAVCGHHHEPA